MTKKIPNFYPNTEYYFLSNFYPSSFLFMGILYRSNEHFYQAAKCEFPDDAVKIIECETAKETKKFGKKVQIRKDWDKVKIAVMRLGLRLKFEENEDLKQKLLATGDAELVEGNTWHDVYWGCDSTTGEGKNYLGKLLMELRSSLRKEE